MTSVTDTAQPDPAVPGGPPVPPPGFPAAGVAAAAGAQPPPWAGPAEYAQPDRLSRFFNRLWVGSPLWVAPVAMLGCMAGAVGYTLVSNPVDATADAVPSCLLKYATGFICPGCGGTRAAWYLLHADLPAAARHHALFVFAVPFLLYIYVAWAGRRLFGRQLPQLRLGSGTIGVFLAVWGVFTVLRNLPWEPFTWFFV